MKDYRVAREIYILQTYVTDNSGQANVRGWCVGC